MSSEFDLDSLIEQLGDIYDVLFLGANIASLSISGIMLLLTVIGSILTALLSVGIYVFSALPVYRLSKKLGKGKAWLAWIPFFGRTFRTYVICDAAGDKPVSFFGGKIHFKSRGTSFLVYVAIAYVGSAIIATVLGILSFIPIINYISSTFGSLLLLVPAVICSFFEYVYLKDLLDLFKEDQKSNKTAAIAITIVDALVTGDIIRTVWLYSLWKRKPLEKEDVLWEEDLTNAPMENTPAQSTEAPL